MDRYIFENCYGRMCDPIAQILMKPVPGREVYFPAEPSGEILAQIHERNETEATIVDVSEEIDV